MATRTILRLILASHNDNLIVRVDKTRLVVESIQTKPAAAWHAKAIELLGRQPRDEEIKKLVEQIRVECTSPGGGPGGCLRVDSAIALFATQRHGEKAFWIDKIQTIETSVSY